MCVSYEIQDMVVTETKAEIRVRPIVRGKFIYRGSEKFWLQGVTYGTFRPNHQGELYPEPEMVARDFTQIAAQGINTVRTYTVPPGWLLDLAEESGLYVMVGLPWEQHVAFLDEPQRRQDIEQRVRQEVSYCAGHPAVLCYTIGNEIPASIVRWYGPGPVERFLKQLYRAVKGEDPESLVTYVNYPTTEYLNLPFLDFVCFNVYLESQETLAAYLARLHNLAGDRPLVMAEIGLDSQRNGMEVQAETLDRQLRTIFAAGCAGCFVFAWTDEWYRGGFDIEDWDFGLTDRQRQPKPALAAVSSAFAEIPFPASTPWPSISVAVCSYNGSRTIRDTLEGLQHLDYPDYEVIVVDDGSQDGVADIAREYAEVKAESKIHISTTLDNRPKSKIVEVKVIVHPENQGLSYARNTALAAATGEIIAYIDDDAYPDPHWLTYLAATFLEGDWAGVGGPNLLPPEDGPIADCVANAPGGPIHVLLSDREAEHIPGCNMAYWKSHLQEIGGFDPRFRAAGDDVDICWRLQERGWHIGFSPAAFVWHHRRNSVKAYWKQQQGYGKAEALLEEKWPQRYNAAGHVSWSGRLYGKGIVELLGWQQQRIYHGTWGSALFQSLYQSEPGLFLWLPAMPEWYLILLLLGGLSLLGIFWPPLLLALPALGLGIGVLLLQAAFSAYRASFAVHTNARLPRLKRYGLTTLLYLLQPVARLRGRLDSGLTPWRRRGDRGFQFPWKRQDSIWSESWRSTENWLEQLESHLESQGAIARRGSDFDSWDLEVRGGLLGSVRILMAIEEHGGGKQLLRFRCWPRVAPLGVVISFCLVVLWGLALWNQVIIPASILGVAVLVLLVTALWDCGAALACYSRSQGIVDCRL